MLESRNEVRGDEVSIPLPGGSGMEFAEWTATRSAPNPTQATEVKHGSTATP